MSVQDDIDSLQATIARGEARKAELEALTNASRLMRQAGEILLKVSSPAASAVAEHLADACALLAGPKEDHDE